MNSLPTHLPDISPVVAGIHRYLDNRAPFDAFIVDLRTRGLTVTYDGYVNKLLISPRDKLNENDMAYIRRHREELVQSLIMEIPITEDTEVTTEL